MLLFGSFANLFLKMEGVIVSSASVSSFQPLATLQLKIIAPWLEGNWATDSHQCNVKQVCWPSPRMGRRWEGWTHTDMLIQLFVIMLHTPYIFPGLFFCPWPCILLPRYDIWRQKHRLMMSETTLPWTWWPLHFLDQSTLWHCAEKKIYGF